MTTRHLVAVLATPPLTTSGDRTRRRVELAARLIGCASVEIQNLLLVPTATVLDVAAVASEPSAWIAARMALTASLDRADAVLLGWGHSEPAGPARELHRAQVAWLRRHAARDGTAQWTVGGTPRHPSRWQRYTARTFPDVPFERALAHALQPTVA